MDCEEERQGGKRGREKEKRGREAGGEGREARERCGWFACSQSVGAAAGIWQRRRRLYYRT